MEELKQNNTSKGDDGEKLAAEYLSERGYFVLFKKWKYMRFEIDLIVEDNQNLVFVEVKTRYSHHYSEPWEAVNKGKRKRIIQAADAFLKSFSSMKEPRFDIVSIVKSDGKVRIEHIAEAFYPQA